MQESNTHELSFTIKDDGQVQKAIKELFHHAEGFPMTIYIELKNGDMFPVANIERHPDCPPEVYDGFLHTLLKNDD